MKRVTPGLIALFTIIAGNAGAKTPAAVAVKPTQKTVAPKVVVPAVPSVESIETSRIKDLTATLTVNNDQTNFAELKKIGGAFATTYRLKRVEVSYKQPGKVRFESRLLGLPVVMVYNGDKQVYRTPIKSGQKDVGEHPGQKQSLMDLGIFATDYLNTDFKPVFQRQEGGLLVYKLVQRNTENKSHEMVWVNPKTSITERRQTFNGDSVLQKELRYKNPRQIRPGIWVPTRIEIYNQFGKLGAVQDIEDIKVNLGVDEEKFNVS
jgi:outer membrane lipoprotein-sorting protein